MRYAELLMTSSARPSNQKYPALSRRARSPAVIHPWRKKLARALRVFPIAEGVIALVARALRQISHFSGRQLKPVVIDERHLKAGHRQPHGAGLYLGVERVEIAQR